MEVLGKTEKNAIACFLDIISNVYKLEIATTKHTFQ